LPSAPNENHYFQQNDVGLLTLNLTIEKNDANNNPIEITTPTSAPFSYPPSINIAGYDAVQQKGATLTLAKGSNNQERVLRFKKYSTGNYGTILFIGPKSILDLSSSTGSADRAHVIFESYCNSKVEQYGILLMRSNSMITLTGNSFMRLMPNAWLTQHSGSEIEIRDNAILMNCGAKFFVLAPIIHIFNNGRYIISNTCPSESIEPYTSEVDSGGSITLSDNSALTIEAYNKIIFDGSESYLKAEPGTSIEFGEGTSIEFKNGAYLDADGCTFTGDSWNGLKFYDAGASSIQNCTFTGAENYIELTNFAEESYSNNITISGNTFNNGTVCINNTTNCYIADNTFYEEGNSLNLLEIANTRYLQPESWSINIVRNSFAGGLYQLRITGLAGNVTPLYVFGNTFNTGASIGFWANNVSGALKYNKFTNNDFLVSYNLLNSSMNLYNNTTRSIINANIFLVSSIARLSPVVDDAGLIWYGGLNKLNAYDANCLYFSSGSDAFVDKGNNCFNVLNEPYYHISGSYSMCFLAQYYSTHNLWNTSPPQVNVLCDGFPIQYVYEPIIETCPDRPDWELQLLDQHITDMGNGVFDTLFLTGNYGGEGGGENSLKKKTAGEDRILFAQALKKKRIKDYPSAITACKNIINSYDTSKYLISALDELFINNQYIDTIAENNSQMTQLKNYLTQKIQQHQNNTRFVDKAYSYLLKSLTKLREFNEAIAGYENIINNHPDPVIRLSASWERAAVILLMNGQGGAQKQLTIRNEELRIKKNKKIIDKNPAHKISQKSYTNAKRKGEFAQNTLYTKEQIKKIENNISLFVPSGYKELQKKMSDDMKLLAEVSKVEMKSAINTNIPNRFNLSQNFPNPFNPVTEIKYELPINTYISIKVYNALGEVVTILVNNEYRTAGIYSVKFDGTNYASGIYFYNMETKNFRETKKMILIK